MQLSPKTQLGLLLLCWGLILSNIDAQPAPPPRGPLPGLATDCELSNGTACFYSLGKCLTDPDCEPVLSTYLTSFGFSGVPPGSIFTCVESKCDLITPSTLCAPNASLPTCSLAPAGAPESAPTNASNPVSILPTDCSLTNEGGTKCAYELGTCQENIDCKPIIASYLSLFNVSASQLPADADFGCLQAGKCEFLFPTDGCLPEIKLPTCVLPPGPAPLLAPVAAPVSILPSDCYFTNAGGTDCTYVLGTCRVDNDCPDILSSYFYLFGASETEAPANATYYCLQDGKCDLLFPSTGCLSEITLPTCIFAPGPAPASTSTAAEPDVAPAAAPQGAGVTKSTVPPPYNSAGVVSAPSPAPSNVPSPPTPTGSAACLSTTLWHGLFFTTMLMLVSFL